MCRVYNACKNLVCCRSLFSVITFARRKLLVLGFGALSYSLDVRIFLFVSVISCLLVHYRSCSFFDVVSPTLRLFVCLLSVFLSWPVLFIPVVAVCDVVYVLSNLLLRVWLQAGNAWYLQGSGVIRASALRNPTPSGQMKNVTCLALAHKACTPGFLPLSSASRGNTALINLSRISLNKVVRWYPIQ